MPEDEKKKLKIGPYVEKIPKIENIENERIKNQLMEAQKFVLEKSDTLINKTLEKKT